MFSIIINITVYSDLMSTVRVKVSLSPHLLDHDVWFLFVSLRWACNNEDCPVIITSTDCSNHKLGVGEDGHSLLADKLSHVTILLICYRRNCLGREQGNVWVEENWRVSC